ncbi:MAG: dTDP-4-dehydrorhamnose 3,5-epimerase [Chitinophagales bacterium]|nr:dTDP-4-dehydrorhamnose 3,5-epimerase [Chitinophagales bacterium]OJV25110.1 MAG: dTDP-4-dehydrorhamnose 3,5-epimerase [Bacteroidetes bacterium 37-13]HRN93229.1 dTDP-4-dehydrorhamnose 3,5-epimerase [Chitinophagales bacterium]HRP39553.1 dTDP-4-dehydrorhamnose 3,5-epimerase [Chitinophagales bacterium]
MPFKETGFRDLKVFEPKVFADSRGYFFESFNKEIFAEAGINSAFVQDNESCSNKGVLRGLHYQHEPFAQAKLVRVVAGKVLDIVLDIRKGSPTFGKYYSIELSAENKLQLYIPHGFAHGFSVLEDNTIFQYKCDNFYSKESEGGINGFDPALNIDWGINIEEAIVSDKDKVLPDFENCVNHFVF